MQKILKLFEKSPIIQAYTILDYKSSSESKYLKAKLELKNGDLLYLKEYTSANEHLYSYHWQKPDGSLMIILFYKSKKIKDFQFFCPIEISIISN